MGFPRALLGSSSCGYEWSGIPPSSQINILAPLSACLLPQVDLLMMSVKGITCPDLGWISYRQGWWGLALLLNLFHGLKPPVPAGLLPAQPMAHPAPEQVHGTARPKSLVCPSLPRAWSHTIMSALSAAAWGWQRLQKTFHPVLGFWTSCKWSGL